MKKVSVILPIYNEAKHIDTTLKSLLKFSKCYPNYSFILVNDGSADETQEILDKQLKITNISQIQVISYQPDRGKGNAVKVGVENADGDYICYIDSDLAYSLEHLILLVEKLEYFDIVIGCRNLVPNNFKFFSLRRMIAGKIFNCLSRAILDLPFEDMQAGIKGFHKDVANKLFKRQLLRGFSFDVELIYLAKLNSYNIGEIAAVVSEGHSDKISKVNLLKDSFIMFFDLLIIKFNHIVKKYQ